jgi:Dyp-type peroxidase family
MVRLDLKDIQGNILRGYRFSTATYLFLRFPDETAGRAFLRETVDELRNAEAWESAPQTATNLALTFTGLQALGVDESLLGRLPAAFREPMRDRARRLLGDTAASDPDTWHGALGSGQAHALVMVAAGHGTLRPVGAQRARAERDTRVRELVARAVQLGIARVHRQEVQALEHQREHFGWADGFGQPAIEGVEGARAGQGIPLADGQWRSLKAGEFVHGYPDEDGQMLSGPTTPLLRNGTFMVYRKLQQNVARFRAAVTNEARHWREATGSGLDADQAYELVAAKLVGRWRDGVAIELVTERAPEDSRRLRMHSQTPAENDFRYCDDADGFRCPRGAHIRRVNPRDAQGWGGTMATRHRIIRRSMPYGEVLPDGAPDDAGRGLIFICFNSDLERQFEMVQAQWCNDGNAFGLGNDKDYLLGNDRGSGKVTIEGRPPYFARAQRALVETRGSEYFLMPGINALRDLAEPRPKRGTA